MKEHKCTYENSIEIEIVQKIKVDKCISEEIIYLNTNNVRTEGCCCGHGRYKPNAVIRPSSVPIAKQLGYNPIFDESTKMWLIELKTEVN